MTSVAPSTPPTSPPSRTGANTTSLLARFRTPAPTYTPSQADPVPSPASSLSDAKHTASGSPMQRSLGVAREQSSPASPNARRAREASLDSSPTRQSGRLKGRKGVWPRKHHEPPPPVPDLPPFLNIALPFESYVDDGFVRATELSQALDKHADMKRTAPARRRASSNSQMKSSPAATGAQKVTQQYAAKQQQLKESGLYRARALAAARLTPSQVVEVVKLAGAEIRQRGVASVGILRPFRVGAHPANVDRLAELFLLSSDPDRYDGVFSVLPASGQPSTQVDAKSMTGEIALATLGRPSASKELVRQLASANIHDVGDFLKWSVRRLKLDKGNFGSETDTGWYTDFVKAEKDGGYQLTSFSDNLLPRLPASTRELLTSIFDLLTTISAHFVANAMPASRVCKTWGFWLFGRIGQDESCADFQTLLSEWKRSTSVMEHLMMAFIRDQSAKSHSLPTRLTELIKTYACSFGEKSGAPGLPNGINNADDEAGKSKALKLHLESKRLLQSLLRYRGPPEILHCALNAHLSDCGSSAEADDWSSLVRLAHTAARQTKMAPSEDATVVGSDGETTQDVSVLEPPLGNKALKLAALLTEEQLRVSAIYAEEFANRRKLMGFGEQDEDELEDGSDSREHEGVTSSSLAAPFSSATSTYTLGSTGITNSQSFPLTSFAPRKTRLSILAESVSSNNSTGAKPKPPSSSELAGHKRQPLASVSSPPPVSEEGGLVDWKAFREAGFASESPADLSLGDADIHRTLSIGDVHGTASGPDSPPAPHQGQSPMSKLRRHTSLSNIRRRAQKQDSADYANSSSNFDATTKPKPSYSIASASAVELDEGLVSLWQDAVLDPVASANLPSLVFVALNNRAASTLMSPAGPGGAVASGQKANGGPTWLMIEEMIIPYRPQMPKRATTGARPARFRSASSGYQDEDAASLDGKRSLFAPSMRSIGASILKKRPSLKKISSFATLRRRRSGIVAQANADASKDVDAGKKESAPSSSDAPLWSDASGEASVTSSEGYVLVPTPSSSDAAIPTMNPPTGASGDSGAEQAVLSMTLESALSLAPAAASTPRPVPVRSSSIKRSKGSSSGGSSG